MDRQAEARAANPFWAAEPVAIVGIGCRFPGANGPEEFWRLLREGRDAITEMPADRFDLEALYDPRPGTPGKICTRNGGFLEGVDRFDAAFFGISPREAARMDPQQRLLLEVAWEALEDGGQVPDRLAGTPVGVYLGMCYNDYEDFHFADPMGVDIFSLLGGSRSVAAGRVAHALAVGGPTLCVDAACASSLITVHLACFGLWSGDCTLALAGGVNLILEPQVSIGCSRAGMLAPDGRCKFCDSRADGYVRSEGIGIVALKLLSAARADGDPIYAVIRGGAMNNDGTTGGSMVTPGRGGQEAVLRLAYQRSGIDGASIQYVEAHGTGTKVGDPVELGALGAVLGVGRSRESPLIVGSVKSNIGHAESAAGVAGLIKAALCLHHGEIPASLHVLELHPEIPWSELPIVVQRELAPWPATVGPRRAGVNSFGINGANAHIVLEEAPAAAETREAPAVGPWLFPLSARSPEALAALARSWIGALGEPSLAGAGLPDIGYMAARRRSHHKHRLALVARDREEIREALTAFVAGEARAGMAAGRALPRRRPRIAFVFPGQGSQWFGMGRELMAREPVFRQTVEACDRAIQAEAGWSLLAELEADEAGSRLGEVDVIQPAIFALQVSLAALWHSWGVEPGAVVGQSLGEVAASCVAGALSLEDACRVICRRSRLVRSTSGQGGMAVVELSLEEARRELDGREGLVSIAVSNSPESTVLSGDRTALGQILERLEMRGVFCRWIKVDYASHSPQMEPLREDLLRLLSEVSPRSGSVPIYSTVTGEVADGAGFDASYWVSNLREPVLFAGCLRRLLGDGFDTFIEVSPHPVVLNSIQQCLQHWGATASTLPSARQDNEVAVLLGSLGALYAAGHPIDWSRLHPGARCVPLPRYPWQRKRFWIEGLGPWSPTRRSAPLPDDGSVHPLLGRRLDSAIHASTSFWEAALGVGGLPYLGDHRLQGVAVMPAAACLEMALGAASQAFGGASAVLGPATFEQALFLDEPRRLQFVLAPAEPGGASFQLFSGELRDGSQGLQWTLHATGTLHPGDLAEVAGETLATVRERCGKEEVAGSWLYASLAGKGLEYGPAFQGVRGLRLGDGEALAEIRLPLEMELDASSYQVHPVLLDACFQVLAATLVVPDDEAAGGGTYLPVGIGQLRLAGRPPARGWCHAVRRPADSADSAQGFEGDVVLYDPDERPVLEVRGLRIRPLAATARRDSGEVPGWLHELVWEEVPAPVPAADPRGGWLILADRGGVGATLAASLEASGCACLVVQRGEEAVLDAADCRVRPGNAEDLLRLVAWADETLAAPWRGVVHAWGIDTPAADETSPAFLEPVEHGCWSATLLVQALARGEGSRPRLFLVTRGAQAVGDGTVAVTQAALWGLGRVVAHEHPELRCRLVDLPPEGAAADAELLLREVLCDDEESQVAYRGGGRRAARWVRGRTDATAQTQRRIPVRADGSYLITGGLGGLGLAVAEWLAGQGARHLALVSRGRPSAAAQEVLDRLERSGAQVMLLHADVARADELAGALARLGETLPPLAGVVHAAGVLDDKTLLQLDLERLRGVLAPKVQGSWNLHLLTREAELDFFVLFSSLASVLGSPGQGNYSAANAFLDGLAHHRGGLGLPALAINWGAWSGIGLAASADRGGRLARQGMASLRPDQGIAALAFLLGRDDRQISVTPFDPGRWRQLAPSVAGLPLFSRLAVEREASPSAGSVRQAILEAAPAERRTLLDAYIRKLVAHVLGFSAAALDFQLPINRMGLDSLMAMEVRNRAEMDLGIKMPVVMLLQGPTLSELADQLSVQLADTVPQPASAGAAADGADLDANDLDGLLAGIDDLSEAQVDALLGGLLAGGEAPR
jgi:myxalamid-type polyketide synthase MxaE and MxaD